MKSFASDNYAGVLPEILEKISEAASDHQRSYGADEYTARATALFRQLIGKEVSVHFAFNGTGANILGLSTLLLPYHAVLCADSSHLYVDESNAPEGFTGCRFIPLPTNHEGKLTPDTIDNAVIRKGDIHHPQARVISITQTTEYGTVYTIDEIKAIRRVADKHDLLLHMDGARLLNAVAHLGCSFRELLGETGIDVVSFGGTKAGLLYGEAVLILNENYSSNAGFFHKKSMQLASKARFIAAQFIGLLENDTWRHHVQHANNQAQKLAKHLSGFKKIEITKPVQANSVFAIVPAHWIEPLQQKIPFYVWNEKTNEVRLMCSFDTSDDEIEVFINAINNLEHSDGH